MPRQTVENSLSDNPNVRFVEINTNEKGYETLIPAFYDFPIHDRPQTFQLVGAAVLKVEVVSMFPNVKGKQRL